MERVRTQARARRRKTTVAALASAALATACSVALDFDALEGDGPGGGVLEAGTGSDAEAVDAKAPDGGSPAADAAVDALADASDDAGTLLYEQRFDGPACNGWSTFQATNGSDPSGRAGAACRVCMNAGVTDFFSGGSPGLGFVPAVGTYRAEAWVRTAPDAGVTSGGRLHLRQAKRDPFTPVASAMTPPEPFSTTWSRLEVVLDVTKAEEDLDVFVTGGAGPNACFLVDDVKLYRVK